MEIYSLESNSNAPVSMIPIEHIEILNPRDRNEKVFAEIVESIRTVGLKKPITVTKISNRNRPYQLICGEGRIQAFKQLGATEIPARIIDVNKEEALIMSLVENIARRQHRAMEFLSCIERLSDLGYDKHAISKKTGLVPEYIQGILTLLKNGEERLLYAVEQKKIPLSVALNISKTADNNSNIQIALQEAYESGDLKGHQLLQAKRVIERRQLVGKNLSYALNSRTSKISANDVVKTYQKEVERLHNFVKRANHTQQVLAFITGAISHLKKDENFFNLLRAESLDTLPQYLEVQLADK
ncbi:ParB/RepB/Spo0J family partition protein [Acinetobacter sp. ANC 4177]|uniref:ParB/RepB/Spo0J family partition protein n=1 Tax=Acinetobacter sp. ANC 4177 TaxID=2529838 RepID=UPI00103B85F7|nr:ParB/RepB/Spo0J family partition protein [Acinetobacter sp. ANC 4177]TCB72566.1 ParB/RepB/Spo0J family partition protein [Acinetobacter sp. ANC 4177]